MVDQHFTRDLHVKRDFAMHTNINANARASNYTKEYARVRE